MSSQLSGTATLTMFCDGSAFQLELAPHLSFGFSISPAK